jgi:hypothetical protein
MRGGLGSDIVSLPGAKSLDDIEDVKYMREKLFSAIKIPQAYLTDTEGSEDKSTLAQKDIRFARTIQRLQRAFLSEIEKIAVVHLYTLGFRGEDLISFRLTLNNPSKLAELQQLEYMKTKFDIANSVPEGIYSNRWVSKNILGMTDDEFLRNQREAFYDRKYQQALEAVTEEGMADLTGGDLGGDLGGGFGADLEGGPDGGLAPSEPGGVAPPGEMVPPGAETAGETALLSPGGPPPGAPGRKDPTSHYEKSSYVKTRDDRRQRGKSGPRTRKSRSDRDPIKTHTKRAQFPGLVGIPQMRELISLPSVSEQSIYHGDEEDEVKLMENTVSVRQLVRQLEAKEAEKNET